MPFSARASSRAVQEPAEARALSGESLNAEEIEHKAEQKRRARVRAHAWRRTGASQRMKKLSARKQQGSKTQTLNT